MLLGLPLMLMVAVMVTGPAAALGLFGVPQGPLSAPNPVSLFIFSHFDRCVVTSYVALIIIYQIPISIFSFVKYLKYFINFSIKLHVFF